MLAIMKTAANVDEFLSMADQFRLGELVTEQPHPLTRELSTLAQNDIPAAIATLKQVDRLALEQLATYATGIIELARAIGTTFSTGGRIFLCGCGATGRLSLSLETLSHEGLLPPELAARVIAFMAGGDAALIRSLEGFEDFPGYGERQLRELGFCEKDRLIAITEGGETPFVIGACEAASRISRQPPWFLYCNPDTVLACAAERSRNVLNNSTIRKLNLTVGAMALAGSTRMQASTVQMLAAGLALQHHASPEYIPAALAAFEKLALDTDWGFLAGFIEAESYRYTSGSHLLYETDDYGITVLTDTTERAPTFSLNAFENTHLPTQSPSLCYLSLPPTQDSAAAWEHLLHRAPRCLEWSECSTVAGLEILHGFDISSQARKHRRSCEANTFHILSSGPGITLKLGDQSHTLTVADEPLLSRHLLLKLLLNTHSTLIMGRLGRYEGNLMTWVKPSNNKLIDRAVRYILELYTRRTGKQADYAETARLLYRVRETLDPDEAIVLKTLEALGQ